MLANDYVLNVDKTYTSYKIPLERKETTIGNENDFKISNGNIVINSNKVHAIKVSGNLAVWQGPDTNEVIFDIRIIRNNTSIMQKSADNSKYGLCSLNISPAVRSVQQGDIIEVNYAASTTGTYTFIGRSTHTFLTVEKVC